MLRSRSEVSRTVACGIEQLLLKRLVSCVKCWGGTLVFAVARYDGPERVALVGRLLYLGRAR